MRRLVIVALGMLVLAAAPMHAEQKNVKVLTGLSDYQLIRVMQLMRVSLGVGCDYCHAAAADGKELDFPSDAKKEKETARKMMAMVQSINAQNFKGRPTVSCNSCHRGATEPVGVVSLPAAPPPQEKPESAEKSARPTPPSRDAVVAKYAAAIGNPSPALWQSRALKGTREGLDGKLLPMTIEEAPGLTHVRTTLGNDTIEQAATSTAGWSRNAKGARALSDRDLAAFHSLTDAYGPPLPQAIPADARVFKRMTDGGHEILIVFFRPDATSRERLEFDASTGLLLKRVTLADTPVGVAPQQTDFDDWREVGGGVKYPFMVRVSPIDARLGSTRRYSEVKLGAKIDEKTMEMPK